jgi:5'-nucleotidase
MKILITNDDGIDAPGIKILAAELGKDHEILVIAPDRERSGVSHALNLQHPGSLAQRGEREYACSGTPADCVYLAQLGALPFVPEAVVSGINRGPNLGTDILYSGTCGAVRQASLSGLPGIAVSCAAHRESLDYLAAASFVRRNFDLLISHCSGEVFINVNAPSSSDETLKGRWTRPGLRRYHDRIQVFDAPDKKRYCFLVGGMPETVEDPDSDYAAVEAGLVAVSPILVHPQVPGGFVPGGDFC